MYQFLGNVNVFHSRLHGAWAEVTREDGAGYASGGAVAYVRPHDIDLDRQASAGAISAVVRHVHPIGAIVRVELEHEGDTIEVELTRERHLALELVAGQTAWLRPRQVKVFAAS